MAAVQVGKKEARSKDGGVDCGRELCQFIGTVSPQTIALKRRLMADQVKQYPCFHIKDSKAQLPAYERKFRPGAFPIFQMR